MEKVLDKIGQEIKVGDIIVYGGDTGYTTGLRIYKVLGLVSKRVGSRERVRIRAHGIDDVGKEPRLSQKGVSLTYPNRCLVVAYSAFPAHLRELLDKVPTK